MPLRNYFPTISRWVWFEICIRVFTFSMFLVTDNSNPFMRIIQEEEVWLYRYPHQSSYVTTPSLYVIVIVSCLATTFFTYLVKRNASDSLVGLLVVTFAIPLTGVITNCIKLAVGRPRPDYFDRCFPGVTSFNISQPCTGDMDVVLEGRKSFPSGHSSMSFCTAGFISLYLAGKLGVFNGRGRGQSWRLIMVVAPIVCALMIAVSRTCDYHHHWQDVTIGSILGFVTAYVVYHQYYPALTDPSCHLPHCLQNDGLSPIPIRRSPSLPITSNDVVKNV